ncbi:MAG: DUF115 domain-containing protein [Treponema sp.]|nr:DUF115 domain-containing protein [Treponema sp.]
MSYLEKNKAVLLKHYPGFWEDIIAQAGGEPPVNELKIETASTGDPTLCINGIHIHSPRDPQREGQRLAQAVSAEKGAVVVLGFGLGYAAQAAAELGRPVIIVEKYNNLFFKALELRDLTEFFSKYRVLFLVGGSGDGITSALVMAAELIANDAASAGDNGKKPVPSVIYNRALIGLDEQWYKTIESKIRTWGMKDDVNLATHRRFGQRWVRNLSRNMSAINEYPGVYHLAGLAAGNAADPLPVFLAAAGPSLDKIKPLLRDIYNRCIIVAVDTSLRFFVKNGIQPDFVLVVDPQFWNSRHLDRCVADPGTARQTALIAETAVYPPVLNLHFKNKFLCSSMYPPGTFIEKQVDPKGRLGAGGSVATTAWDFARTLGANEIWIAGLDLAFPELKTHFRGARFEEQSNSQSIRFNPVEKWIVRALRDGFPFKAKSANGGQVLTDRRLSLYAAWFEYQFNSNPHVQNYSFFQDGLAITGLQAGETKKFLTLPNRREEIDNRLLQVFSQIETVFNEQQEKQKRVERYKSAVSALNNGLADIKTAAEEGAEIAQQALKQELDKSQQEKVLKELEEVSQRISQSEFKEIADFLFPQPLDAEKDEDGSFRANLKTSLKMFTGLAEAAGISF